jgi:hypothetical protein
LGLRHPPVNREAFGYLLLTPTELIISKALSFAIKIDACGGGKFQQARFV